MCIIEYNICIEVQTITMNVYYNLEYNYMVCLRHAPIASCSGLCGVFVPTLKYSLKRHMNIDSY